MRTRPLPENSVSRSTPTRFISTFGYFHASDNSCSIAAGPYMLVNPQRHVRDNVIDSLHCGLRWNYPNSAGILIAVAGEELPRSPVAGVEDANPDTTILRALWANYYVDYGLFGRRTVVRDSEMKGRTEPWKEGNQGAPRGIRV